MADALAEPAPTGPAAAPPPAPRLLNFKLWNPDWCGLAAIAARSGIAIDVEPGRAGGTPLVLWLGPGERLIETHDPGAVAEALAATCGDHVHQLHDVGDGLNMVELAGPNAQEMLAHRCRIDLDPHRFPPGACARTLFARMPVILHRPEANRFRLFFARSLGHAVESHLADLRDFP